MFRASETQAETLNPVIGFGEPSCPGDASPKPELFRQIALFGKACRGLLGHKQFWVQGLGFWV